MDRPPPLIPTAKNGPHPRNRHRARYDFTALIRTSHELAGFIVPHPLRGDTIDFFDPVAVTTLNRALLRHDYGLTWWDIPAGYLCPPIPGRADYIHHAADLLGEGRLNGATVLDIGTGANCIYPIIGVREYGWRFVGSDIDSVAIQSARKIVAANPVLVGKIECRLQPSPSDIFNGIVRTGERFELTVCNPPFHASAKEAAAGTLRKLRNLGNGGKIEKPVLNFGGRNNELWCPGGESAFVRRMIAQSVPLGERCRWFTTLVSKRGSLPAIYQALKTARAMEVRTIAMSQGQKHSRLVAWTFLTSEQHANWRSTQA